jgi:hypothetical protein
MFYMYFLKWTYLFQFVRVTQQIVELILASTGIRPDFSVWPFSFWFSVLTICLLSQRHYLMKLNPEF